MGATVYFHPDIKTKVEIPEVLVNQLDEELISTVEDSEGNTRYMLDRKLPNTTIPFVKGNDINYSSILAFFHEGLRKYTWVLYILVVIFIITAVSNGANLLFIITNDGWWGHTPGHRQHFSMARLRAIELRRSIARSANTGISCFIDQRGDVYDATSYWEPAVISRDLNINRELTFYARMGDYIGRLSVFLTVLFSLISVVFGIRKRKELKV